jgi:hypothetical protein
VEKPRSRQRQSTPTMRKKNPDITASGPLRNLLCGVLAPFGSESDDCSEAMMSNKVVGHTAMGRMQCDDAIEP